MQRYLNRHTYAVVFTALLLIFFSIIVHRIQGGGTLFVDEFMKGRLQALQTKGSLAFFTVMTELGSEIGIISTLIVSLLVLWRKKQYAAMIIFPLAIIVTDFVNKWVKGVIARERPLLNEAIDAIGYSFPSGHAMLSIVTYGFVAFLIVNGTFGKATRILAIAVAAVLIFTIGLSRIVLSVHYPSDVLGGYCLGGMLLVVFLYAHHFLKIRMK
ncbi:phosphatase PAP2 family protein [Bacillus sp. OTU530]|uniref:phosphatase PAP2 family protein n=1 Tax=Bacillus sp. OTU530 TaxID=3043862 RepID=UPI00313B000C